MPKWVLDQSPNGTLEYPVLGFTAEPGDTLTVYMVDPTTGAALAPANGTVLVWKWEAWG